MISYSKPAHWIRYDITEVAQSLVDAKAAVISLKNAPYQHSWVETLQELELKREVAGTSRIEGAEFTEPELDAAMRGADDLLTRSQKQATAAVRTYRWIAELDAGLPIDVGLLLRIHSLIVGGCDDDHCPPGELRIPDQNVTFGQPRHRGVGGGKACRDCFGELVTEIDTTYKEHDPLVRAVAAHYHLAAMHPFLDGNGRTARALEALLLMRAGLRDSCFIAMSNYYYEEKTAYLNALAEVTKREHDLTPFLVFALKGVALQSTRLLMAIRKATQKLLFRDTMRSLAERLRSKRKRVLNERQFAILDLLLEHERMEWDELWARVQFRYAGLKAATKAVQRDFSGLLRMRAVGVGWRDDVAILFINLDWPTLTEKQLEKAIRELPRARCTFPFRR